ncbi:MAG: XRE family transcriptional regulator [Bacteroidaceae bacterium]|nr:XRE family transcriptional regulator [Bacteroidaceae bacterium]
MGTGNIVGEKIRFMRKEQKISREQLAEAASLSVEQLERIEQDEDLPSLAPLIKIARVLGVRLGTFLDESLSNEPSVCRKMEAIDSISFSNNSAKSRTHMEYKSLAKSKSNRHMEPFMIDVLPLQHPTDYTTSSHEGEEFILVREGQMEISYGTEKYILNEGDSIYYDSIVPHHVHTYGDQSAKILAVIYTPV